MLDDLWFLILVLWLACCSGWVVLCAHVFYKRTALLRRCFEFLFIIINITKKESIQSFTCHKFSPTWSYKFFEKCETHHFKWSLVEVACFSALPPLAVHFLSSHFTHLSSHICHILSAVCPLTLWNQSHKIGLGVKAPSREQAWKAADKRAATLWSPIPCLSLHLDLPSLCLGSYSSCDKSSDDFFFLLSSLVYTQKTTQLD